MRIGYEAKRLFCNFTGLGNYARTLVSNLMDLRTADKYVLFTPRADRNVRTENYFQNPRCRIVTSPHPLGGLWRLWGVGNSARHEGVELFHGLSNELPEDLRSRKIPSIVTIHDLIFRRFPHQFGHLNSAVYDWKFRSACRRADIVVAISESTRADLQEFYGVPAERVRVVYQSCDPSFAQRASAETLAAVRLRYGLPSEYLLYVGSVIERKNLLNIVKALRAIPHGIPLAVVGGGSDYKEKVASYARDAGLEKRLLFLPPIPFSDLPAVYQGASCFIYPSFIEGFGIPLIEAHFSGVPVVTSNCSSLPEAGGPGALQVSPDNPEEIAAAVVRFLEDGEFMSRMTATGREYVERFRGEVVAGEMRRIYCEVLGR